MMNKDLIYVIEQIGREKGIGKEVLFEALESALLSASKKTMGAADNVRMEIDRRTGTLRVFARKKVVTVVTDAKLEIGLADGRKLNGEAQLDDELEIELAPQEFGRIAAQTAKQVILQRVRDAERDAVYSSSSTARARSSAAPCTASRSGTWWWSWARRRRSSPSGSRFPATASTRATARAYMLEVKKTAKGPQILLSRTHPGFLVRLFETEIPEIAEGIVLSEGGRARAGRARQGRGGVHQARRRSDRGLRGPAGHAHPGHQPGAARREDRHRRVVARLRGVRGARPVARQGRRRSRSPISRRARRRTSCAPCW